MSGKLLGVALSMRMMSQSQRQPDGLLMSVPASA